MEQPESAISISDPSGTSHLEIQSPSPSAPGQDPDPQSSSYEHVPPDHAAEKDEEQLDQLRQLVDKQLELVEAEEEEVEEVVVVVETERDSTQLNGEREVEEEPVEQFNYGESNGVEEADVTNVNEDAETLEEEVVEEENERDEEDEEWKQARSNGGGMIRQHQFPVRPDAEDCSYYMKTGNCRFASNCKFNHPVKRKTQVTRERPREKEESAERPGQIECKYYLRTGGCKYGKACRFNHSKVRTPAVSAKSPVVPLLEFNFLGLPIRPGERECPYYMRNGSCKYGSNCRFNHPDPTVVGANEHSSPIANGGSLSINASSHSPWSPPPPRPALNEAPPFVPIMFPPNQGATSQNLEWNAYQAPVYPPPERGMAPPPSYVMTNPATGTDIYSRQQQPILLDEYPERPGQPDCSYFLKTGGCKFKGNCKFNHPKHRITKSPSCVLSDKGLPLRPDQNVCAYYSRYGICKFGPACKFDHPIQPDSTGSPDGHQFRAFGNSGTDEEDHGLA